MDPAELLELFAGFAEDSEDFAVEREFVDAAGEGVGGVENLVGAGGDADGPGCAGGLSSGGVWRGFAADGGGGTGVVEGDVDGDLTEEFSVAVEDLDAAVAAVGYVDVALCVGGDAVRGIELAGLVAGLAEGHEPLAVLVDLGDA